MSFQIVIHDKKNSCLQRYTVHLNSLEAALKLIKQDSPHLDLENGIIKIEERKEYLQSELFNTGSSRVLP